jgi:hypothetical protein
MTRERSDLQALGAELLAVQDKIGAEEAAGRGAYRTAHELRNVARRLRAARVHVRSVRARAAGRS